ncbi:hypothetical protein GRI97_01135 [Altererythrobacter xixiisoli]|uniref:Glycosyltransferase RgtA/B/C/D-like domain-containing protein n=1 Tax=Croceibacterium xixiisoli TaxID=1476466 RepID=A0A6I4TR47_9SPHN|nr:hypothetical protein [Croceibacterium xixiisoli]MXO97591.1 hypothetical protein [Croceibacterium xixiisoli]
MIVTARSSTQPETATGRRPDAQAHGWALDWAQGWKIAALVAFAAWVLAIGARHEPWFDEAQAWLLARDSGLVELLAERVRYEGTPGLWHAILWIAIRCGLPYAQFQLLPAGFAIAGAAVVLWRAPFPGWMRLAVIFSYFFAYQYSVVARSYTVDLLLIPLAAAFFAQRSERPLRYALVIGLIANLNAHGFLAAAVLGLELAWHLYRADRLPFGRQGLTGWQALAIAVACGLFALACAWQPADNNYVRAGQAWIFRPLIEGLNYLRYAYVDRLALTSAPTTQLSAVEALAGLFVLAFCLIPLIVLVGRGPHRWLCVGVTGVLLLFSVTTYANYWHSGLLYLFSLFALWISWPASVAALRRHAMIGFAVIAALQIVQTARTGILDARHVYSPGRELALFLADYRASHPDARISAFGFKAFAAQPWQPGNAFDGIADQAYVDWSTRAAWEPFPNAHAWQSIMRETPDVIVAFAPAFDADNPEGRIDACQSGYVPIRSFAGTMVFRGFVVEDNSLVVLERRDAIACR